MGENSGIIKGAEAFFIEGNEIGLLLSHGFMGTPQSVRFIGEKLAELGYTVLAPRLKGHGTDYYDLESCKNEDWFHSLEEPWRRHSQHSAESTSQTPHHQPSPWCSFSTLKKAYRQNNSSEPCRNRHQSHNCISEDSEVQQLF